MGLFSAIASFFGASKNKKAAKQAADVQSLAAQQGIDTLGAQSAANTTGLDATLAALLPFLESGQQAVGAQGDLLGLNGGGAQGGAIDALKNSPLFASLFGTGQEAILANASATGGLRGGNVQRSLADFGSDTLARVIQNQLQNLGGLSTQGLEAAQSGGNARLGVGQINSGNAANIGNLFGAQGQAKAGGILGKANAENAQFGSILDAIGSVAGAFLPTGGLGGTIGKLI